MRFLMFAMLLAGTVAAAQLPVVKHEATVSFDLTQNRVTIEDAVLVPAGLDSFALAEGFQIEKFRWAKGELLGEGSPVLQDTTLGEPSTHSLWPPDARVARQGSVTIDYSARVHQNAATMQFSRENVANEVSGTIGEDGIYLSGDLPWLPSCGDALNTYKLTVITPLGWIPVTNGTVVSETEKEGLLYTVFDAPEPSDGITLIAQKYTRYEATAGKANTVKTEVYLLQPDDKLRDLYLERTQAYIAMYEEMIGPYPYGKFATVENWFPTGYGMPGWTLLGAQVMRLPFIPYTSFGHEIAHNWWGNGVMVDPAEGNWCEGLTAWCADYHYKELESADAARDYRRTLLKDYAAYVGPDPALDFPLVEFTSRHSGATRAVGYGKSMMIWHMLDRKLGRDVTLGALRAVYAQKRFQRASWSDFFNALGGDLAAFKTQWLTRAGAPVLHVDEARRDGDKVKFTLWQESPTYVLDVPVVADTPAGPVKTTVHLDGQRAEFTVKAPGATRLSVDPDYDLFRRLHQQEIEPTVSQVLAEDAPLFVLPLDPAQRDAAVSFATAFSEDTPPVLIEGGAPPADVEMENAASAIVINPAPELLKAYLPAELQIAGDLLFLGGKRYPLKDNDLVFAARNPQHPSVTDLLVLCRSLDRLPSLGTRLGHYGKYSWLVLPAGAGQVQKGNWAPAGNPLSVDLVR